jgi:hypothetical protein
VLAPRSEVDTLARFRVRHGDPHVKRLG